MLSALSHRLVADMFAIVQFWEAPPVSPCERGRLFEQSLYRYCEMQDIHLDEKSGSRTLQGQRCRVGVPARNRRRHHYSRFSGAFGVEAPLRRAREK